MANKFTEAFPLGAELAEKVADPTVGKEELLKALETAMKWKADLPEEMVAALSVMAHAAKFGEEEEDPKAEEKVKCPKCGVEVDSGVPVCPACGADMAPPKKDDDPDKGNKEAALARKEQLVTALTGVKEHLDKLGAGVDQIVAFIGQEEKDAAPPSLDDIAVEIDVGEPASKSKSPQTVKASELMAQIQEALVEVLEEGVR